MFSRIAHVLVLIALTVFLDGKVSILQAEEFALLPPTEVEMVDFVETQCTPYCIFQIWYPNTAGANWTSPVDYAGGTIHVRHVVRELQKHCQLGLYYWWNGDRSQHGGGLIQDFNNVGDEKTTSGTLKSQWSSNAVNWSNMGNEWRFQIRDGNSIQFQTVAQQRTYLPLKYNATVVLVPAGETFSGWDNYPLEGEPVHVIRDKGDVGATGGRGLIWKRSGDGLGLGVGLESAYRLQVVNGKGQIVVSRNGGGPTERAVDAGRLPAGVYVVRVISPHVEFRDRFVNQ